MTVFNLEKSVKEIFDNSKYAVPLYQRNYAWRKNEIEQLLQDVYEAFRKNSTGNYFIGSLVVLKRQNGDFEVIDGQQRLTTLSLITKILGINGFPCMCYDSRPEVEEFFKVFYKNGDLNRVDYPQIIHLKNAIDYIKEANLDPNSVSPVCITNLKDADKENFIRYFSNNVILIRVEIPEDTDVASYFEIMNNRGVQLQKHEILKSFLIEKIDKNFQQEYGQIWDACSQMDVPIQRAFGAEKRKRYFGDNYDDFIFASIESFEGGTSEKKSYYIEDILNGVEGEISFNSLNNDDDELEEDVSEYKSIIDFPNFLMHVLKLKYQKDIPLNEKYLLLEYEKLEKEINAKDFIKTLFFCRVAFDRFIVKTMTDKTVEDEIVWTLRKPTKYSRSWKYTNSFGDSLEQNRIVKALSMLQVTFRTRIYKNWLQDLLLWFMEKNFSVNIDAKEYIMKLDSLILQYYEDRKIKKELLPDEESITKENSYSEGTNTPHFIFNFIDYLYWVDSINENKVSEIRNFKDFNIKDFDFKYWNSIEHHMAREWAERNNIVNREQFIDCLGNLCLISKGSNSRLSDRDVKEKVQSFGTGNIGAKRQVMYHMSKDAEDTYTWTDSKIKKHYNNLLELIKKRNEILHIA